MTIISTTEWEDFWAPTIQEREESIEQSLIALSKRKLRLLQEVQSIDIQISSLRKQLQ
jgi:hypothetical protein